MNEVPYYKRDLRGNLDITYFGSGGVTLGFWSNGEYHAMTLDIQDLEGFVENARDHMMEYQTGGMSGRGDIDI